MRAGRRGLWVAALLLATGAVAAERAAALKEKADRLAKEARALAKPEGCEAVSECQVSEFGNKPCGGPRDFIAWCSRTTDAKSLQAKLDALMKAEQAYQEAAGVMSNCGLTRRPRAALVEGRCTLKP
ncbi:hypothetical protein P2318_17945 [Myxococcaceae bacterium GXIMD 01537]